MQKPNVRILDESINASGSGVITGVIFFELEEGRFPDSSWNDMIVVVLGLWLSGLMSLAGGGASATDLRFMDGPFRVSLERLDASMCRAYCIDGASNVQFECDVPTLDLLEVVLSAATRVRKICQQQGWASVDLDRLDQEIKAAQGMTRKH